MSDSFSLFYERWYATRREREVLRTSRFVPVFLEMVHDSVSCFLGNGTRREENVGFHSVFELCAHLHVRFFEPLCLGTMHY
jgi:hypothetical protein